MTAAALVCLLFPWIWFPAREVVEIRLIVDCDVQCAPDGVVRIRDIAAGSGEVSFNLRHGVARLPAPRDYTAEIELHADGFWMPRQGLPLPSADHEIRLRAWRTIFLTGRFLVDARHARQTSLPSGFTLHVQSPPVPKTPQPAGASTFRSAAIECPVDANGYWKCEVPATKVDVVLRAKSFTPVDKWDLQLRPEEKKRDLGSITLRQGASLTAWLSDQTLEGADRSEVRGRLMRRMTPDSSALSVRLSQPVAEGVFSNRGMLQLAPLSPGEYMLEVQSPGLATRVVGPIEIYDGRETAVRNPIVLDPPLDIRVEIAPRTPRPWTVSLYRLDDFVPRNVPAARGQTDSDGVFATNSLGPGRYEIRVQDSMGNLYARREVSIAGEAEARQTIDLSLAKISGTVTLGKVPIAATLIFSGQLRKEDIESQSNAEGRFSLSLPRRQGKWNVSIRAPSENVLAATQVVLDGRDTIAIDLPDTEIRGRVIHDDGSPASNATVILASKAGVLDRRADNRGEFRFRGVPPGTIDIDASNGHETSSTTSIQISEDTHIPDLQLTLEGTRELEGQVVSGGQPVVAARIAAWALSGGFSRQITTLTGLQGEFVLNVPTRVSEIAIIVSAGGRTLQAFGVNGRQDTISLDLVAAGGDLDLFVRRGATHLRVTFNGVPIPMTDLVQWAVAHGQRPSEGRWRIPNVAPGAYRFCTRSDDGQDTCREGLLARGGTLKLGVH